jgi:hypothetical protein
MARTPLTRDLRDKGKASLRPTSLSHVGFAVIRLLREEFHSLIGSDRRYFQEPAELAILNQVIREYWKYPQDPTDRDLIDGALNLLPVGGMTLEQIDDIKKIMADRLDRIVNVAVNLGEQFLAAAEDADPERLDALAARGAPVNYHDPRNGATALHYVAAQGARPALRVLLKTGQCDFLARDDDGLLVSEMAGAYGRDLVMERLLLMKEIRQARQTGVPFDHIYRRDRTVRPASPSPP